MTAIEAKHTPGPWEILDTYEADLLNEGRPRRETVWEISNRDAGNSPAYATSAADASLIAAAPELLEALQVAVFAMGAQGANHDLRHPLRPAWEQARAAIAKAEGRD